MSLRTTTCDLCSHMGSSHYTQNTQTLQQTQSELRCSPLYTDSRCDSLYELKLSGRVSVYTFNRSAASREDLGTNFHVSLQKGEKAEREMFDLKHRGLWAVRIKCIHSTRGDHAPGGIYLCEAMIYSALHFCGTARIPYRGTGKLLTGKSKPQIVPL